MRDHQTTVSRLVCLVVGMLWAVSPSASPAAAVEDQSKGIPEAFLQYVSAVPDSPKAVTGVREMYYVKPFCGLLVLPNGSIITEAVMPSTGLNAADWSPTALQCGYYNPSGGWRVGPSRPLFDGLGVGYLPFSAERVNKETFLFARLRPGVPSADSLVYRNGGFQSYQSVNRKLLRKVRFLNPASDGAGVEIVNGLGERLVEYKASKPVERTAIEINTKYTKDGFNSVWGLKNTVAAGRGGWSALWMIVGRTAKDGANRVEVTELHAPIESAPAGKNLRFLFYSPDVSAEAAATAYYWSVADVRGESSPSASLSELVKYSVDVGSKPITRYVTLQDASGITRFEWDTATSGFRKSPLVNHDWQGTPPCVCVQASGFALSSSGYGTLCRIK